MQLGRLPDHGYCDGKTDVSKTALVAALLGTTIKNAGHQSLKLTAGKKDLKVITSPRLVKPFLFYFYYQHIDNGHSPIVAMSYKLSSMDLIRI